MDRVLLGNIVSFVGSVIMILTGLLKNKKQLLTVQVVMFAFFSAGNLILGAVTGAITNGISIVRNLVTLCTEFTLPLKAGFAAIQIVLCAIFNRDGLIGWLPVVAVCLYTWSLSSRSIRTIKLVIIVTQMIWLAYDLSYRNYSASLFDAFTALSNVVGIRMLVRGEKKHQPDA